MLLETPRLIIRFFTSSDFTAYYTIVSDPEAMRFSICGPLSLSKAKELFQIRILDHYTQHGFGLYAIVLKETQSLIGFAGFLIQEVNQSTYVELGYRLLPSYWGKSLAFEAADALIPFGFQTLHFERMISLIEPENTRSIHLAKKLGFYFVKATEFHGKKVRIYEKRPLILLPYDPKWKQEFEDEKKLLLSIFDPQEIAFFHIGSTSIPGCVAKPIIDILGSANDINTIDSYSDAMEQNEYEALGEFGMPGRRYFRKRRGPHVHLHIFQKDSPEIKRHLLFCEYLRKHPEAVQAYNALKLQLLNSYSYDVYNYTKGKDEFIRKIDSLAEKEFSS